MASPEPSAAAGQRAAVEPLQLPTPEEIKGQEMMNNCAVRSVLSGVMGGPQASCIGCVGFGAFSVAIEKFMERYN
ncbi:hypothetical protein ZWY2020_024662 [Hordeum vulgare]|nr:hypothetical protein ZWY2020_024662 [Hordeum vulgare]